MNFNEKKAIEIVAQYNLAAKTIAVWRTRGSIPDKYFEADYKPRTSLSKSDEIKHDRVISVVSSKAINLVVLAELAGINEATLRDAKRGKSKLTNDDSLKLTTELKRLKIEIAQTFERYSELKLTKLLKSKLLYYSVIVNDSTLRSRIDYVRTRGAQADRQLFDDIKDSYVRLALTLNV